jgi:hypothetical protein
MSPDDLKIPITAPTTADVGFVLIGRNEGERLKACIASVLRETQTAIYVDSGSVDGSAEFARSAGVCMISSIRSRCATGPSLWMRLNRSTASAMTSNIGRSSGSVDNHFSSSWSRTGKLPKGMSFFEAK